MGWTPSQSSTSALSSAIKRTNRFGFGSNLPHATFNGGDAQLDAAIDYLLEEIRKDPREVPPPPPYPDKSFNYPEQQPGGGQS